MGGTGAVKAGLKKDGDAVGEHISIRSCQVGCENACLDSFVKGACLSYSLIPPHTCARSIRDLAAGRLHILGQSHRSCLSIDLIHINARNYCFRRVKSRLIVLIGQQRIFHVVPNIPSGRTVRPFRSITTDGESRRNDKD